MSVQKKKKTTVFRSFKIVSDDCHWNFLFERIDSHVCVNEAQWMDYAFSEVFLPFCNVIVTEIE